VFTGTERKTTLSAPVGTLWWKAGSPVAEKPWERARLIPVSGISGPDEQERRGVSALLAVVNSVREFGRAALSAKLS
jgi:hypothetical protein